HTEEVSEFRLYPVQAAASVRGGAALALRAALTPRMHGFLFVIRHLEPKPMGFANECHTREVRTELRIELVGRASERNVWLNQQFSEPINDAGHIPGRCHGSPLRIVSSRVICASSSRSLPRALAILRLP